MSSIKIKVGDCIEKMREIESESVHAIVTDPPYGIEFMGKTWDSPTRMVGEATGISGGFNRIPAGIPRPDMKKTDSNLFQQWCEAWAIEAFRVLKPGGHLLAFGGTRMYHRLACGIEDAGFEIRDTIAWMYGSGFPKSHNVEKGIEARIKTGGSSSRKLRQVEQEGDGDSYELTGKNNGILGETRVYDRKTFTAETEEAKAWKGWGTALKPAHEPVVMARKPLTKPGKRAGSTAKATVAENVMTHGTGAMNIDGCRVGTDGGGTRCNDRDESGKCLVHSDAGKSQSGSTVHADESMVDVGRWPANVILDEESGALLDAQVAPTKSTVGKPRGAKSGDGWGMSATGSEYEDSGGPSRFFYCAKASRSERESGLVLDDNSKPIFGDNGGTYQGLSNSKSKRANGHPTVKPITLMSYLCRLVTPPGGTILDPFLGSGTTGIAAVLEGFDFIGIEREQEYVDIAVKRIKHWKSTMETDS